MKTAEEYFKLLDDDTQGNAEVESRREELNRKLGTYNDNPAYQAIIRIQELAKEQEGDSQQKKSTFKGRARRVIDLGAEETDDSDDSDDSKQMEEGQG